MIFDVLFGVLILIFFAWQVAIPIYEGRSIFPWFRHERRDLETAIEHANDEEKMDELRRTLRQKMKGK